MNLQQQAQSEKERRTRSKLEAHREAILALRRKHWTHRQITEWLNARGVQITLSAVHRFCQQAIARRPRGGNDTPAVVEAKPVFTLKPETQTNQPVPMRQHRFNTDI
jgi:hypothetical protein